MALDPKLLQKLRLNDPSLTELNLSQQKITTADVKQLVEALETNNVVVSLDLGDNLIDDEGAKRLAELENIRHLELRNNNIGPPGAAALAANKYFQTLELYGNHIGNQGAIALATADNHIYSLDIGANGITDGAMASLGANSRLTELLLIGNQITDRGAIEFAKRNENVEYLHLWSNQVSDAGAVALAGHPRLKKLILGMNKLTDKGALAFKDNIVLRELDVRCHPLSQQTIDTLSQSKTLQCLRYNDRNYIILKDRRAAEAAPAAKSNAEKRTADSQASKPVTRSSSKKQAVATPQAQNRPSPNKLSPG